MSASSEFSLLELALDRRLLSGAVHNRVPWLPDADLQDLVSETILGLLERHTRAPSDRFPRRYRSKITRNAIIDAQLNRLSLPRWDSMWRLASPPNQFRGEQLLERWSEEDEDRVREAQDTFARESVKERHARACWTRAALVTSMV
jgi:DNA-directed RNA polymerase specialized sigma24 family protein